MKDIEIIEQFIMDANGGIVSTDEKFVERALLARLPYWRQTALLIVYNGSKTSKANTFINPKNYVQARVSYDANIQVPDSDFVVFQFEPPVNLDARNNGIAFIGDELTGETFIQLPSLGMYSTAKDAGLINPNKVYVELNGGGYAKAWGNTQLRELYLNYIPVDVTNVTVYNPATRTSTLFDPTTDQYPVSEDVLSVMFQVALPELLRQAGRPADTINDSVSTLERPANKQSIV